jgi:DNA-binding CsgD family transcriptional regulator
MTMIDPQQKPAVRLGEARHDRPDVTSDILTAINMLNLGILIVDHEARITFANQFAKRLLQSHSGLSVNRQDSSCASRPAGSLDRRLRQAISRRRKADDVYLALPAAGDKSLIVLVVPCRSDEAGATDAASSILFVSDPAADSNVDLRPIARLYGLTGAETRLLDALVKGQRTRDYAKLAGITLNTVKGHLNQLFRKTQTSRQSQLVLRVLANPAFRIISEKSTLCRAEEGGKS